MQFVSSPNQPQSQLFTCLTCQIAFPIAEGQRDHYRTDWHRYNLKRKVVDLPPIDFTNFQDKIQEQKTEEEQATADNSNYCAPCKKSFNSENTFLNHQKSKKHIENAAKYDPSQDTPAKEKSQLAGFSEIEEELDLEGLTEEEKILKIVDHKISRAVRLQPEDCIFCPQKSDTFEANMEHMTKTHDFFIPDIEYLVNLKGLIKYLSEKVSVANVCLHCNGKGRELKSLEAVRKHMKDKGHCKIAYDLDMDIMEISDFYDYRPSYGVALEGEDDEEIDGQQQKAMLAEDDMELVLPSGTRLGHRALRKYYKQHIRPASEDDSTVDKMLEYYEEKGYTPPQSRGRRFMITQGEQVKVPSHHGFKDVKHREQYRTRVGVNANRLQRHFREQIL